jgi:hypothetical protein
MGKSGVGRITVSCCLSLKLYKLQKNTASVNVYMCLISFQVAKHQNFQNVKVGYSEVHKNMIHLRCDVTRNGKWITDWWQDQYLQFFADVGTGAHLTVSQALSPAKNSQNLKRVTAPDYLKYTLILEKVGEVWHYYYATLDVTFRDI